LQSNSTAAFKKKLSTDTSIHQYLKDRTKLFLKICYPSIHKQMQDIPCDWYLLIDDSYQEFIADLLSPSGAINNVKMLSNIGIILETINASYESPDDSHIYLTTRVDNDDALASDFLQISSRISATLAAAGVKHGLITFPHGIQYNLLSGGNTYLFNNNHFLNSFHTQKITNIAKTPHAIAFNHSNFFTCGELSKKFIVNTNLPMWLEYIHDTNQINKQRYYAKIALENSFIHERFSIQHNDLSASNNIAQSRNHNSLEKYKKFVSTALVNSGAMKPPSFAQVYSDNLYGKKINTVLEIGIHQGNGIKFLKKIFGETVKLIGVDIKQECADLFGEEVDIYIGSQSDAKILSKITDNYRNIDLIIDDGSHKSSDIIRTLNFLFPYLTPGGIYLVEDIFTSYWKSYGGGLNKQHSFIEVTKDRIDQLFVKYMGATYQKYHSLSPDELPNIDNISPMIDSIKIYAPGIAVLIKKMSVPKK